MNTTTSELDAAISLLAISLRLLRDARREAGDRAESSARGAAWRLADAGILLRRALQQEGIAGPGISEPTGRGATLPA